MCARKNTYNVDAPNKTKTNTLYNINTKHTRYIQKQHIQHIYNIYTKYTTYMQHTHHIHEQHTADDRGMIEHFHKNTEHNLMILCEECHRKEHE